MPLWLLVIALVGCCAPETIPETLPAPLLPPGRPPSRNLAALESAWIYSSGPDGQPLTLDDEVSMPVVDLGDVLQDRAEWRAYAEALEAAGRWVR